MKFYLIVFTVISLLFLPFVLNAQQGEDGVDAVDEAREGDDAGETSEYFYPVANWQDLTEASKTNIVLGLYMGSTVGECMLDGSVTMAGSTEKRKLRRYLLDGWGSSPDTFVEEINAIIDEDTVRISGAFIRAEANFAVKNNENNRAMMLIDSAKIIEKYYPPNKEKGLIGSDIDTAEVWSSTVEVGEENHFAIGFLNGIDTVRLYADAGERVPFSFRVGQYVTEMNKVSKIYTNENDEDLGVAHLMLLAHINLSNRLKKNR